MPPLKLGLFGIGLDAYWPQFAGLKERLEGYLGRTAERLGRAGVEIVNLGLVDTPEKALAAGHQVRQADVDLIFLHGTTSALSSPVPPGVARGEAGVRGASRSGGVGGPSRTRRRTSPSRSLLSSLPGST